MMGAAVLIVLAAAFTFLVSQSSRILEQRLEQALGENFSVESLSLSWNRIELNEPRFMKDGQITAQAKRIIMKPETLALLKPGFPVSSVVLEEPSLTLQIDEHGQWVVPFVIGEQPETASASKPGPVSIQEIEIKEGTLFFQDQRRPEPNRIEFRKIDLSLDRVAFPLEDEPSTFALQVQLAGNLVSGSASGSGTIRFKPLAVDGRFEGQDLVVLDGGAAGPAARVQSVRFTAASKGTAAKGHLLSDLVLVKPYLRLESDREGRLLSPLPVGWPKAPPGEKEGTPAPMELKNLKIEGGELLYLDGEAAQPPVPLSITGIDLTADQLSFPAGSQNTAYRLSARLPGSQSTGVLTSSGNTALKTLDTDATFSLHDLDLTSYKTYVLKEGDADISRGFLDLDMDLGIKKRMLNAPARSVLRDIRFVGGSDQGDRFLGLPRDLVVKALQNNNNQISFDMVVEGSLDNPEFNLRERIIVRMTAGLARRLGLSVVETGGKVIIKGGEIIKGVGDAITKPLE